MSDEATQTVEQPNGGPSYDPGARLFHWVVAVLVVAQIPTGVAMTSEPLQRWADPLFIFHKGAGSLLLVVLVARIVWRVGRRPPPFPDYVPKLEQRIAGATHIAIYGLLLVMAGSGYVRTVGDGFPIEALDALGIPPLIPLMPEVARVMIVVHQFAALALVALVAVHVSAVLRHRLIDGAPILARMWPPVGSR